MFAIFKRELTEYEVRKIRREIRYVIRMAVCVAMALFGYLAYTGNPVAEDLGGYVLGLSAMAAACLVDRLFSGR